ALVPVSSVSGQTIRPGNLGRNSARVPGLWTVNLGLGKNIAVAERMRLQFRLDAMNAFNHVNLGSPNTSAGQRNYGLISGGGGAGILPLTARLILGRPPPAAQAQNNVQIKSASTPAQGAAAAFAPPPQTPRRAMAGLA